MRHNLTITNYRVFEHLSVDTLKRVNLIVGANNAGKTSLLEAIHLLAIHDKRTLDLSQPADVQFITTNHLGYSEIAALWDRIVFTPSKENVVEALRLIEPSIERISFTAGRASNNGIWVHLCGETTPIPLDSMGNGVRRILAISIALVSIGQGTLLIDEIDTGFYYATLKNVWSFLVDTAVKQGAQVFATTHSWDCVKAFQQALRASAHHQEGSLLRLDRENNQVKVTTYSTSELDIAISQGIELR